MNGTVQRNTAAKAGTYAAVVGVASAALEQWLRAAARSVRPE
jgi:hypothetical protein